MATFLERPVKRLLRTPHGGVWITIDKHGVTLRGFRRRHQVKLSWAKAAQVGLINAGASLTAEEWAKPLAVIRGKKKDVWNLQPLQEESDVQRTMQ